MTYISVAGLSRWPNLFGTALLCIALTACDSGSGSSGTDGGGAGGIPGPMGCLTQNFQGQPDVLIFPQPPLTQAPTPQPPTVAQPGVAFSVFVDADTRLVKTTFVGAYVLDPTAFPQTPSEPALQNTAGSATLDFVVPVHNTGRYYVEMELCGSSCDDLRVVYTLDRAFGGEVASETPELQPINNPYERIVYRDGVEVGPSSNTCDKPRSVAMQN